MNEKTRLSFNEILSVDTIVELESLYHQKGFSFSDFDGFLSAVKQDWKHEFKRLDEEAKSKPIINTLPFLETNLSGVIYRAYGVFHTRQAGSRYWELVSQEVMKSDNWLLEQELSTLLNLRKKIPELPDHLLDPGPNLKEGFFLGSLVTAMIPLIPLLPLFTLDYILDKENRGKKVLQKQEDSLKTLNLPLDICSGDLPAYVDIGLNEYLNGQGRVIYTPIQKRSAYQTEFMKAWRAGEDTNILTGARHSSQIKYFLEKGVKDPAIVDLAHIHAELLEKDPEKFYNILYQNKRKENIIQIASLLSGAATTASILSPAIYYLVKYSSIAF